MVGVRGRDGRISIEGLYRVLRSHFGFRYWWPGDTKDEIVIGAILTQQTTWRNVEKAIENLKREGLLSVDSIARCRKRKLEGLIRSTGYYKQKSMRLIGFCKTVSDYYGGFEGLETLGDMEMRSALLSINGIGPETADSIMLYAAGRKAFVVDAYTKRIFSRIYGTSIDMPYDEMQRMITSHIPGRLSIYKDFHAQLVELGKNNCRTVPVCGGCPVAGYCMYAKRNAGNACI
jgi:endonuclease-3 related protein